MTQPNLNLIQTFLLVLEKGSFSAAGKALGVPASTISRRMDQLESELRVTLLDRSTRRIKPTKDGCLLRDSSLPLMEQLRSAVRSISERGEHPEACLRISVPPHHSQLIAELALDFHRQHPWISLQIVTTDRRLMLREEGIDVVIRVSRSIANAGEADLVLHPLVRYPHILCCSPAFLEKFGEPTEPGALPSLLCVGWGQANSTIRWEFEKQQQLQTVLLRPALCFNDYTALQAVLVAGYGIGELPAIFCVQALREGKLIRVMRDWNLPSRVLFAGSLKREFKSESIRLFLEHCQRWRWYEDLKDLLG
ncbi:MAG: LysR family transcriptional regulator [Myxococcota bacterium]